MKWALAPEGRRLFGENFAQSSQRGAQGCRGDGSGAFYQTDLVNSSNLIEQDEPLLAAMPYGNTEGRRMAPGGHRCDQRRAQIIVHLRRRDHHAGASFLNLAAHGGVEINRSEEHTSELQSLR